MNTKRLAIALASIITVAFVVVMFSPSPTPQQRDFATQHETARSSQWGKVRKEYMAEHPEGCAVCGSKVDPQVHHCQPFREHPELELDKTNLIWLCGPKHENHHLIVGHAGNYKGWNPHVREDAALLKTRYDESRVLAKEPSK